MNSKYECELELYTYICDGNELLKPSGALQITQECGRKQMEVQKPSYEDLLKIGQAMMLSRLDLKIYDEIKVGDVVTLSSWPCNSTRATFLRMYEVKKDGRVVAEVASQWVLVEYDTRKILKVDDLDMSNYYIGEYHELVGEKFRLDRDADFKKVDTFEIKYSHLDSNRHMNNTYYMDMLCDCIPELAAGTHRVKTCRTHYAKEAPMGDKVDVYMYSPEKLKYQFRTVKADGELNLEAEMELTEVKGK